MFFDTIAQHIQALPLAVQAIALCVVLALADFVMAVVAHLKQGDFHGTIFGEWITSKGLPIVVIALLVGLDSVLKLFISVDLGDTDLGGFGVLAAGMAASFIAQETFSILKNARLFTAPATDPVPEE